VFHEPCLQGKCSRNQVPAVDYFYSAAERRLRGALWPSFALALRSAESSEKSIIESPLRTLNERFGDYALTQNGALVKPHHALFYSLWNTNVSGML
jgi:hypothetical protein